jgi:hypothetical protein
VEEEIRNKARAWDALEEWLHIQKNLEDKPTEPYRTCRGILHKMSNLLAPPQPKGPLEELEEGIKEMPYGCKGSLCNPKEAQTEWISRDSVLAEIRRLKEKK